VIDDPMFTKPGGVKLGKKQRGVTIYSGEIAIDEK
jgi:hypothetical protein